MNLQKTIKSECKLSGKGLFSGNDAKLVFKPSPENTGIVFVRTDLPEPVTLEANVTNLGERSRRTALKKGSVSVETIEHCLAAVYALQIDNLIIEVDAQELPNPDSSSAEYYKLLSKSGIVEQNQARREITITEPVSVTESDAGIYALPHSDEVLNVTYDLDYGGHTGIGRQVFSCRVTSESFERNLASARTFLLEAEAKQFQARGIGKHLTPRDILVINSDGPIKNSYRFPNECVRHKIVDLIGDISLAGIYIKGRIAAFKSGHALNQRLARKIYDVAQKKERLSRMGTDALLDIRRIQRTLPHRYPFLLVDKIIEIEGDRKIIGIKNVTCNEQYFQGHFPGTPIMPGVLIVEAMAQASGLLFSQRLEHTGKLAVLLGMDNVKFRKAVVPGDQIILMAEAVMLRKRTAQCSCRALVGDTTVAEAQIKFMLIDDEKV